VRQTLFEFVVEHVEEIRVAMDPRTEQELIARMAEAILAVIGAEGGNDHEQPRA
jgi:hypothetical protein